jgi:hypothetical protein
MDDVATHGTNVLEWTATAEVQDTPAGQAVVVTIIRTVLGVPPSDPNTLTLRYTTDTGAVVRSVSLNTTASSQTNTFHFTNDGTSTGTARCGTVEIKLQATRTDVGTYDVETDGTPNTPPATFDTHLDRGWIRGTTTYTVSLSNVSFGGAAPAPFAYDDSIFHRTVLGAAPFKSETIDHNVLTEITGTSASATVTFDRQFANVVDNRFPATPSNRVGAATFPNSSLTGSPWTTATATNATVSIDPRLFTTHLLQIDNSTYSTPPLSGADPDNTREVTKLGFLAFRITNARGEGANGVTVSEELRDQAQLLASGDYPARTGVVTDTRGGQAGWAPTFLTWDDTLPEGTWRHKTTLTTSDATGLDNDNERDYTLKGFAAEFDPIAFALHGVISQR